MKEQSENDWQEIVSLRNQLAEYTLNQAKLEERVKSSEAKFIKLKKESGALLGEEEENLRLRRQVKELETQVSQLRREGEGREKAHRKCETMKIELEGLKLENRRVVEEKEEIAEEMALMKQEHSVTM
jgi:hypothetical protein